MKSLITFIIIFLLHHWVEAQNINIGAIAGVNASQVRGDNYGGFRKAGLLLGSYANFDLTEQFDFQFEINYSEKGSRKNPNTSEGDTDFFLLRMNYIEVPAMIRFKKRKFTYEAGLYYAQLISDHLEDENGPFEIPEQQNQLKDSDVGFLAGLDFYFTESIIMNWRYSSSILPVREFDSGASFRFESGLMHHYISLSMRYEFIGKGNGE